MALAGAIRLVPDEPGVVAVVIFPDNIFKYASSVCRHFSDLCPATGTTAEAAAPSKNEQLMMELLENLKNPYDSVAIAALADELATGARPLVVDVRTSDQFASGHIPGAINIPQTDVSRRASELPDDRDAPIVMVCAIGRTSKETTLYLKSLGYRHVRNLKGGIAEWMRERANRQRRNLFDRAAPACYFANVMGLDHACSCCCIVLSPRSLRAPWV